jgi:hypothetical protein
VILAAFDRFPLVLRSSGRGVNLATNVVGLFPFFCDLYFKKYNYLTDFWNLENPKTHIFALNSEKKDLIGNPETRFHATRHQLYSAPFRMS